MEEKNYLKQVFDKVIPKNKQTLIRGPKFYHFLNNSLDNVYNAYGSMMGAISIETLNIFGKILSSCYSHDILWLFLFTINKIRYGNNIVRKSSQDFL